MPIWHIDRRIIDITDYGTAGLSSQDSTLAYHRAAAAASRMGATGLKGAAIYFPSGDYRISEPYVFPRTTASPTQIPIVIGEDKYTARLYGMDDVWPLGRALIEFDDVTQRIIGFRLENIALRLPEYPLTGNSNPDTPAIRFAQNGSGITANDYSLEWGSVRMRDVVIYANNTHHERLIVVETALRNSLLESVWGDPTLGTAPVWDTLLFDARSTLGGTGLHDGTDPQWGDSVGIGESSKIVMCESMVRRGGRSALIRGRIYDTIAELGFVNGGKSVPCLDLQYADTSEIRGTRTEGQSEPGYRLRHCRSMKLSSIGIGTPDATIYASWGATTAYVIGNLVVSPTLKTGGLATSKVVWRATANGNSGAVEPVWPASPTIGVTTMADGVQTWIADSYAVNNGLSLEDCFDVDIDGRAAIAGSTPFSNRLVKAISIDAASKRCTVRGFQTVETLAGLALSEIEILAPSTAGNWIEGEGVTGSVAAPVYSPFSLNAPGPSFAQTFDIRVIGASVAMSANAVYLAKLDRVPYPKRIVAVSVFVVTALGNLDIALMRDDPAVLATRVGRTGIVAAVGASAMQRLVFPDGVWHVPERDHWIAIGSDNAPTLRGNNGNGIANAQGSLSMVKAAAWSSGIPATIATAGGSTPTFWLYVEYGP